MEKTSFEKKIESLRRLESDSVEGKRHVVDAAIYVHDTIKLAKDAAESAGFGSQPSDETVLAVYDRIDAERLRLEMKVDL